MVNERKWDPSSAIWLVKSGDRITGPFTTAEIEQRVREQEVVVIDEVVTPLSRWRYLRDEPLLAAIVEEIRIHQLNAREDTEIQAPPAQVVNVGSSQLGSLPETTSRHAGYDESVLQERVSSFSRRIWVAALLVLGVGIGAVYLARTPKGSEAAIEKNYQALLATGDQSWKTGRFEDALKSYRQANQLERFARRHPELAARLAALLIQVEGQTVAARRLLDEVSPRESLLSPGIMTDINLAHGLASIFSEDYADAKVRFRRILTTDPLSTSAAFNLGVALLLSGGVQEAADQFARTGGEPVGLLMRAKALSSIASAPATSRSVRESATATARATLRKLIESSYDYRQEALVLAAHFDVRSKNLKAASAKVQAALEVDPDLTSDHWHDPYLYLDPLAWRGWVRFCKEIDDALGSDASKALHALCVGKAGNRGEAARILGDRINTSNRDSLLYAVNAYLLFKSGRYDDARGALRLSGPVQGRGGAAMIRARLCEKQGDDACAEDVYKTLMEDRGVSLIAYAGLAEIQKRRGQNAQAAELARRALIISPRYLPAIRVVDGGKP